MKKSINSMPNLFDCATEIYLNPREFAQQISLSNFLHLTVGLRPNFHRTPPCINIAFNDKKVFSGGIEKEIELNFVLDVETRNKLTIGLSGKSSKDTVIDASGNITADKYIEIAELTLDKFDLLRDYEFFRQHIKYYNYDAALYEEVRDYIGAFNPEFADRIELYDAEKEGLPLFEQHRVHEQLRKALDRKVWLPSGGSLIIEHTEALTVIDVNTGKNVGKSNLEETVFYNNLEAAEEIARQLRLRDIGGIIVIDFIDMEIRENRRKVLESFKDALSRDKTRTQVFEISELGLVEMTRKRIGEGLLTNFADPCVTCEGRGVMIDLSMLD